MEIEVPSTPQMSISDVFDKSEVSVSSFSESPFTVGAESPSCYYGIAHACTAPSTPGLEIAKPNRYRYVGDSSLGFAAEHEWQQPRNWDFFKDSMMEHFLFLSSC